MPKPSANCDPKVTARSAKLAALRREAWASRDIRRVLRVNCVECMGGYVQEIARCTAPECPLFHWRGAESIRKGFDAAADALEREGFVDLAQSSRLKREAGRVAWAERKDASPPLSKAKNAEDDEPSAPANADE